MKRVRVDGGISKDQFDHLEQLDEQQEHGTLNKKHQTSSPGFEMASASVLQSRRFVKGARTKPSEWLRHFQSLNKSFALSLQQHHKENETNDWSEVCREYLQFANDIDMKFGNKHTSGKLLTFGSGDCGQLAHGVEEDDDLMVKFPRVVRSLENKQVIRVACGGLHSAAVTMDGQVYTWGCNDDGALGRDGEENFPARVPLEGNDDTAIHVVAGDCHTAIVTVAGNVYSWGSYKDKEGKPWCDSPAPKSSFKQKQTRPFFIASLANVVDLKCGSAFNLARTSDGLVYSWGLGEMGQLGRKVTQELKNADGEYNTEAIYRDHLTPALVTLADKKPLPPVKAIGCGSYHSLFALSSSGLLYTCGLNNYGQLGIGSTENCWELQLVDDLSDKNMAQVEGGTHHSVVLSIDGEVYSFGRADSGQLGTLDVCQTGDFRDRPQHVVFDQVTKIRMIAVGSNHAIALTEKDEVYSWGYGDMLALGNGKEQDENKPKKVDWAKTKFGSAHVLQVEAGGQHSAILAESKG